jgi:hypothetical protein
VARDASLELGQLIQRGFDHHEHGRVHDALSDWETALRLEPRSVQARRLVEFERSRAAEIDAGRHTPPSRRDTVESPIPQFLAALTERKSGKIEIQKDEPTPDSVDPAAPVHDMRIEPEPGSRVGRDSRRVQESADGEMASDTLEDLPVNAEDIRASANELLGECRTALGENRASPAALAAELALQLAERAPPPGLDDLIEPSRALLERAFRAFLGNLNGCPLRAVPTETLADHGLDQRAAFLMSRMDAMTSMADLIDSSGLKHFDAVRVLAALRRAKAIDLLPPLQ